MLGQPHGERDGTDTQHDAEASRCTGAETGESMQPSRHSYSTTILKWQLPSSEDALVARAKYKTVHSATPGACCGSITGAPDRGSRGITPSMHARKAASKAASIKLEREALYLYPGQRTTRGRAWLASRVRFESVLRPAHHVLWIFT